MHPTQTPGAARPNVVKHLDHLNLTVANLEATAEWYARVFDFTEVEAGVWKGHPWRILRAGEAMLCLYEFPDLAPPTTTAVHGLSHFALRVTDEAEFLRRVTAAGVPVKYEGPVRWPHSTAIYIDDPTGYEIEVVAWHDDTVRFPGAGARLA